jgi:hypothetical protein
MVHASPVGGRSRQPWKGSNWEIALICKNDMRLLFEYCLLSFSIDNDPYISVALKTHD